LTFSFFLSFFFNPPSSLFSVPFLFPVKRQLPVRRGGQAARDPAYLPADFGTFQANIDFVLAPLAGAGAAASPFRGAGGGERWEP